MVMILPVGRGAATPGRAIPCDAHMSPAPEIHPPPAAGADRDEAVERELRAVGEDLWAAFPSSSRQPLRALDARAMELATGDLELRAALFRFVDVVPACRSLDDLARHLTSFLAELPDEGGRDHISIAAAMRVSGTRAGRAALGAAAAGGVRHLAHRFIVGESPEGARGTLRKLWDAGVASSVDLLGEATVTQEEADRYAARCLEAVRVLSDATPAWPARPTLESDGAGPLPRANVCVKISALTPLLRPDAPARGQQDAAARLRPLLREARDRGAHLHIDMESLDSREAVLELVLALLGEEEFRDGPSAGLVLQAYLRDSPATLDQVLAWTGAGRRRSPLTVRLVKGAYWDHELVQARQHGWQVPVFEDKAACDRNFEALTRRLLDARADGDRVRVAIASHNLRSVSHAIAYNRVTNPAHPAPADLELQILRGLGDDLATALASRGHRVRAYCPVGDLVAGMAYLVRRLLENTSNDSFLSAQASGVPLDHLLAAP
jgi:RHH-type proline utilization regulon transcriptional repressor/proline dehydrogenase/delta 1-pyrroline-5-carboxylate dehydrogenase